MKAHVKDIYYTAREICKGSGNINLLTISGLTVIVHLVWLMLVNRDLFYFLTGMKGPEDYKSIESYISALEGLRIDNITFLIPVAVTALLFSAPSRHIKSNIQNRLLPTDPWVRMTALLLNIFLITVISSLVVYLLDQGIAYYMRQRFLPELIALQESMGDLYKQLPNDHILSLSQDYRYHTLYTTPLSTRGISFYFLLTSMGTLLLLNLSLIFTRYNKIKGPILIAVIVLSGGLLRDLIQPTTATMINVTINRPPSILLFIILISMVFSLYYLLKEREE